MLLYFLDAIGGGRDYPPRTNRNRLRLAKVRKKGRRKKKNEHQREGVNDGAACRRDPTGVSVELERGPGGAAVSHPERLLLQADHGRSRLLQRKGSQGGPQQGSRALLPHGRPPEAGRGR